MSINISLSDDTFKVSCDEPITFVLTGDPIEAADPGVATLVLTDRHCCDFNDCGMDVLIDSTHFDRAIDVMMMNNQHDDEMLTICASHIQHVVINGQKALVGIEAIDNFGGRIRHAFREAMYMADQA